jgi:hypothetical protein
MTTYVQYVQRQRKIGDIARDDELAWEGPVGVGTNRALTREFKPKAGDHIYLASALHGIPAVDARIVVSDGEALYPKRVAALREAKQQVFAGGPGSCWYPLLDATELLDGLSASSGGKTGPILGVARDKNGRTLTGAQRLQGARTIRRLVPDSAAAIAGWADRQLRRPAFISYRSSDGSNLAAAAACYLALHGIPVWYDAWSISIRLDEIDEENAETQLLRNIRKQMSSCSVVVKIDTPEYGNSRWTGREQGWAAALPVCGVRSEADLAALLADVRAQRDRSLRPQPS